MGAATLVLNVADLLHRPGARRRVQLSTMVAGLRGPNAIAGLRGPNAIAGLRGPNADTNASDGLRVLSSSVPDRSVASIDAMLEWVSDGVLATGTVSAPWVAECRRCLTTVEGEATASFQELFEPHPREDETYHLKGDRIDLAPLVREALLLELPLAPLCRAACAGLCSACGADLNAGPCGCAAAVRDPRWAALDELRDGGKG